MNYQDELDQYYNVNEGTIPETQLQKDKEDGRLIHPADPGSSPLRKPLDSCRLDLDLLSDKQEVLMDSCSVS